MRLLLFLPALLAVAIYATTWTSLPVTMAEFFPMHLVALGMILGLVVSAGKQVSIQEALPGWRRPVALAAVAFAGSNFLFSGLGVPYSQGAPEPDDTDHTELVRVVSDHGNRTRWLTPDEVAVEDRHTLRGFAGHWILFTLVGGLGIDARLRTPPASEAA